MEKGWQRGGPGVGGPIHLRQAGDQGSILLTAPDPRAIDTQGIRMRHWCYLGTATSCANPKHRMEGRKGASFQRATLGVGFGGQEAGTIPSWLAPRRPEFGSRATSSSLDVLSQAADPAPLKSLRGLCLQVRPTTRSPHTHTHTHSHPHTLTHAHSSTHTVAHTQSHRHAHRHSCTLHTHSHIGSRPAAGPLEQHGGVGDVGSQELGEGLRLGRDVAQSLTGHQQPQHLFFSPLKGNRFVSD